MDVRLFGSLAIDVGGRTLGPRDLGGVKPKQLFEILLVERGRVVTKDRLAELLWGHDAPRNVAATLETYVSVLRRHVRAAIRTEPGGYRAAMDAITLDVARFDTLRGDATAAHDRGERTRARRLVEEAIALVGGDLLEDEPYGTWALRARDAYRERHERALVDAAEWSLEDGDAAAALAWAERAIDRGRAPERAYRAAMRALYTLGRRDDALATYQRCKAALATELGVEPSDETQALAESMRKSGPSATPVVRPSARTAGAQDVPLLGRTGEIALLERAARAAGETSAALLLVEGEAGVGKTRVLDELVARIGSIFRVARAKCVALERDLAFAPLAHALRSFAGDAIRDAERYPGLGEIVPEAGGEAVGRARAFESLVALCRAHEPLALVLDDLQWADASTLSALAYLLRRGGRLLVVGTYRGEEVDVDHPLRHLDAAVRLELQPLTSGEMAPLGIADIHEKTGGNALLALEYLRAIGEGSAIAPRLRDVVLARCRSAGAEAHRLLVAASVLGRSFDADVLAALVEAPAATVLEQLETTCARKLTVVAGERFDFRHDLIREVLYDALSPARRRLLHARALDAIDALATSGADPDPGIVAHHAELAGRLELATQQAIRAGDAARARFANVEAVAHYERAVRITDAHPELLDATAREGLLLRLGRALTTIGRPEPAEHVIARARSSAEARGDDAALFEALDALTVARHHGASQPSQALAVARLALEVAERHGDPAMLARAHGLVGGPAGSLGLIDESIAHCKQSITSSERLGVAPKPLVLGRLALMTHFGGEEDEAIAWSERAEREGSAQLVEDAVLMARWVRALACLSLARHAEAWAALDSIGKVGRGEETFWHARVPNTYGAILADVCLYDRALERDLEGLEVARRLVARPVREAELHTLLNTAADRIGLGRLDEARADLDAVRRQVMEVEYARFRWLARLHWLDAELAFAEGDVARALGAAEACLALGERHRQPRYEVRARTVTARALRASGKRALARRQAREAARLADERGFVGLSWRAWWAAFEASADSADRDRAERAVQKVAACLPDALRDAFLASVPVRR